MALALAFLAACMPNSTFAEEDQTEEECECDDEQAENQEELPIDPVTGEPLDVEKRISKCAETIGRVERLICYDETSKLAGYMIANFQEREERILETYGFWEVAQKKNAVGEEIIYLKTDAVEEIRLKSGMTRLPVFFITCKHGRTDVYMDWKSRISPYYLGGFSKLTVTYQLDAGARKRSIWELSTDRHAAFVPYPIEFIKELMNHDKLFIQLTPQHESMQTVIFEISGLDKVLDILVKKCYN